MLRDNGTLWDILQAAREAVAFVEGMDEAAFRHDLKTQGAVQHRIILIGEATKRLSMPFREEHTDIPWRDIAGMRDNLIHAYDDVDLGVVWGTVRDGIPDLIRMLSPLLPDQL